MFIKIILKKFFKLQSNFNINDFKHFADKYIHNDNLTEELILKNKFKKEWRKKINSLVTNETYTILNSAIEKQEKFAKCYIKVKHSFYIQNTTNAHTSEEICFYIIILAKKNNEWIIEDLIDKEYNPSIYRNIKESTNYIVDVKNKEDIIKFYEKKLTELDSLKNKYKIFCKLYKTNYLERNYPKKYNYLAAINYARTYALSSNKAYLDYEKSGGDCTNFVSQCLHAGGLPYNSTWKPYTNAWLRVNELYYYLIRRGFGEDDTKSNVYDVGSVIQFYTNSKNYFSHSGIITFSLSNGDYLYCCHSYNKKDYPLSEVFPVYFDKIRIVKIQY